jgi:all-trans-retinol dehydrogenase (NAD+)
MAASSPFGLATAAIGTAIKLPISAVRYTAAEPVLAGSLLYALTRAPLEYRHRLLRLLSERGGLSALHIERLIKTLKYLLGIGVVRRVNQALNKLALNNWSLTKQGTPFDWDGKRKAELVVVTGGCSGFGYEMVKGFAKYARVVILDISPVPAELERCKFSVSTFCLGMKEKWWDPRR